jgi:hypothetical protein
MVRSFLFGNRLWRQLDQVRAMAAFLSSSLDSARVAAKRDPI